MSPVLATVRREGAVPFSRLQDLRKPAWATAILRVLLAGGLAATLAGIVLLARSAGSGRAAVLPSGSTTGVVVLDMSASIGGRVYARVATALRGIVNADQPIGLVMFSDTAYELLPPDSPPDALAQFIRFFVPERVDAGYPVFAPSPWDSFTAGTRISTGLAAGEDALHRARVKHGFLLLISDLNDNPSDYASLDAEAILLRREHVPVRIVPVFSAQSDKNYFAALFGRGAFVDPTAFTQTATRKTQPLAATMPWALLGLGILLTLLLTANELRNTRLTLDRQPGAEPAPSPQLAARPGHTRRGTSESVGLASSGSG